MSRASQIFAAIFTVLLSWASWGLADDFSPVDAAEEALQQPDRYPWYDADKDQFRRLEVTPPAEPPEPPDAPENMRGPRRLSGGLGMYLLQFLVLAVLAGLIVMLIVFLLRTFLKQSRIVETVEQQPTRQSRVDRIEQLPVQVKRSLSDLLGEARRQYQAGNYNEAIIYYYSFLLVELDKAQMIRLAKGKTNRQYLEELRGAARLSEILEQTMVAFEDVFFGEKDLSRRQFEACWQNLDEFQQLSEPALA